VYPVVRMAWTNIVEIRSQPPTQEPITPLIREATKSQHKTPSKESEDSLRRPDPLRKIQELLDRKARELGREPPDRYKYRSTPLIYPYPSPPQDNQSRQDVAGHDPARPSNGDRLDNGTPINSSMDRFMHNEQPENYDFLQQKIGGSRMNSDQAFPWHGLKEVDVDEETYVNTSDDEDEAVPAINGAVPVRPLVNYPEKGENEDDLDILGNSITRARRSRMMQPAGLSIVHHIPAFVNEILVSAFLFAISCLLIQQPTPCSHYRTTRWCQQVGPYAWLLGLPKKQTSSTFSSRYCAAASMMLCSPHSS
jgi:hypothetical protein